MTALDTLSDAYAQRFDAPWAAVPEAVGYIGLDVPVELISAGGLRPVRIVADPATRGAEPFAEGAGAPLLRALTAALTEGPYRHLRRLIISTTPSAYAHLHAFLTEVKRTGDGLADLDIHLFDFNRAPSEAMAPVRRGAVETLKAKVEGWAGRPIRPADLDQAIALHNRVRTARAGLGILRDARLTGVEALEVFGAADAMTPADYLETLNDLLAEAPGYPVVMGRSVVYSGSETVTPLIYQAIEADGAIVVADDQDAGSRSIGPLVAEGAEPIAALAERYFHRDPAPARSTTAERTKYLVDLARSSGAAHVVFNFAPYDHPPAWDYPTQRAVLKEAGVSCELFGGGHG